MRTVLIAESNAIIRVSVCRAIRDRGYEVLEADRPSDAARMAVTHDGPIHALIADDNLPQFDGCALAQAVREIYPELKVIIFSAFNYHRTPSNLCPDRFVQKPSTPSGVADALDELCAGSSCTSENADERCSN